MALNATDVIQIGWDGWTYLVRLRSVTYSAPFTLSCEGVIEQSANAAQDPDAGYAFDENGTYTSTATGNDISDIAQGVDLKGNTTGFYLDIPSLDLGDAWDNSSGWYAAALGQFSGWSAGQIFRSIDGGEVFTDVATVTPSGYIGATSDALADGVTSIWDMGNTVTVVMVNGELESKTEAQVLAGSNSALIGSHGAWEVIQYQTATLVAENTYELSGLLRGRLGTEWATSGHAIGDTFIQLNSSALYNVTQQVARIGSESILKALTTGQTLDDADAESFTSQAVRLKPYPVDHVDGSRDAASDLTITWQRRSRTTPQPFWQSSLYEDSEAYEIDVMDGLTVVRTISASSETAGYTASEQTTDFGSTQSSLSVKIYQLSATVGRGTVTEATI